VNLVRGSRNPVLRYEAAFTLARIHSPRAVEAVPALIEDTTRPESFSRGLSVLGLDQIAQAFGSYGDRTEAGINALKRALDDPPVVRFYAARALVALGVTDANGLVDALIGPLQFPPLEL